MVDDIGKAHLHYQRIDLLSELDEDFVVRPRYFSIGSQHGTSTTPRALRR